MQDKCSRHFVEPNNLMINHKRITRLTDNEHKLKLQPQCCYRVLSVNIVFPIFSTKMQSENVCFIFWFLFSIGRCQSNTHHSGQYWCQVDKKKQKKNTAAGAVKQSQIMFYFTDDAPFLNLPLADSTAEPWGRDQIWICTYNQEQTYSSKVVF